MTSSFENRCSLFPFCSRDISCTRHKESWVISDQHAISSVGRRGRYISYESRHYYCLEKWKFNSDLTCQLSFTFWDHKNTFSTFLCSLFEIAISWLLDSPPSKQVWTRRRQILTWMNVIRHSLCFESFLTVFLFKSIIHDTFVIKQPLIRVRSVLLDYAKRNLQHNAGP